MNRNSALSRRSFLKTLGGAAAAAPFLARDLIAKPRSTTVRDASFGAGGMAWSDLNEFVKDKRFHLVAVADVDVRQTAELRKKWPHVRVYQDWREMLAKEGKGIDSVNVSTPDHMHAIMGMSAMEMGKAVYGQKPLAHDIYEVRRLMEYARANKIVTQMGIQIHATREYRTAVLWAQANAIGKIKEVHAWCPKSWGDPSVLPNTTDPVPPGFDWDLWLGVCEERPFIGNGYYHPANWRKRLDFGTGTFGDMGCHIFDPVFSALKLGTPVSIRSEGPAPNKWNWALDSKIEYIFPGTQFTAGPTISVTWYDGAAKPSKEIQALVEGDPLPETGSIFVGTQGAMVVPHWARPLLYPDKKYSEMKYPDIGSGDHWVDFIDGVLGNCQPAANFDYAGPLTEAVLLGGIASRFPKTTLRWDSLRMEFDLADANQFLRRSYRSGWGTPGLV